MELNKYVYDFQYNQCTYNIYHLGKGVSNVSHRGSNKSAYVLLNLLNKLKKRDKM